MKTEVLIQFGQWNGTEFPLSSFLNILPKYWNHVFRTEWTWRSLKIWTQEKAKWKDFIHLWSLQSYAHLKDNNGEHNLEFHVTSKYMIWADCPSCVLLPCTMARVTVLQSTFLPQCCQVWTRVILRQLFSPSEIYRAGNVHLNTCRYAFGNFTSHTFSSQEFPGWQTVQIKFY